MTTGRGGGGKETSGSYRSCATVWLLPLLGAYVAQAGRLGIGLQQQPAHNTHSHQSGIFLRLRAGTDEIYTFGLLLLSGKDNFYPVLSFILALSYFYFTYFQLSPSSFFVYFYRFCAFSPVEQPSAKKHFMNPHMKC